MATGERFIYNQDHAEIALGYAITRTSLKAPVAKQGGMTLAEAMAEPPRDEPEIMVSQIGDKHIVLIDGQDVLACDMRENAELVAERLAAYAMEPMTEAVNRVMYRLAVEVDYASYGMRLSAAPAGYTPLNGWPAGMDPIRQPDGTFFIPRAHLEDLISSRGYDLAQARQFIDEWVNGAPFSDFTTDNLKVKATRLFSTGALDHRTWSQIIAVTGV